MPKLPSARPAIISDSTTAALLHWINRGLESLWLLTVVLVPLAAVSRDYVISEAVIAYAEVPKIALLRTLVGLMAILWVVEWSLKGGLARGSLFTGESSLLQPSRWLSNLVIWLRQRPNRWLTLAVAFYLATTLLSTVLSASFNVSVWGEVPGQDSYAAYTIIAYVLLFGIIVTHLKTRSQLWRLLGAVVVMGVLFSGYGVLQEYGHDFLDLMEPPEGDRVSVTTGNPVFAAAVLMLTIPLSLMAATLTLRGPLAKSGIWWKLGIWLPVLTVQLMGIVFTLGRGAWLGTMLAMVIFLVLVVLFVGWRTLVRAALVPALMAVVAVVAVVAAAMVLLPSWFKAEDEAAAGPVSSTAEAGAAEQAVERFTSIGGEVAGGSVSNRTEIWKGSWRRMVHHPWFEFDSLNLSVLRPVIGYGPDLFRYTFLLESQPRGNDLLPLEPDQAHNYFLHQGVELGFLGLLSSLGLFVVPLLGGGYLLLRERRSYSPAHKIVLIGLLGILAGRFLEEMVGVARVSDLTIFWVLLAIFVALPEVMQAPQALVESPTPPQSGASGSLSTAPTGSVGTL